MLSGVIACNFHRTQHVVNAHPTNEITPDSVSAAAPEDGRVTLETCREIDS
jgi:hypothetical protein